MLQETNLGVAHALVNNLNKYFFLLVSQLPLYLGQIDVSLCLPRKNDTLRVWFCYPLNMVGVGPTRIYVSASIQYRSVEVVACCRGRAR